MLRQGAIGVVALGIIFVGLPGLSAGQIVVEMGGNPACTQTITQSTSNHPGNTADTVFLNNVTCVVGGVTVTIMDSGGFARVERQTTPGDLFIDQLRLTNAKITTNGSIQNFPISFRRTHSFGPYNSLTYFKSASTTNITISQNGGAGHNSLTMTGYVANPTTDPYLQMGLQKVYLMTCAPPCTESVNLETVGMWPYSPSPPYHSLTQADRNLKVDLALTLLNANDFIDIAGQQIKINSQPKADEGTEVGTGFGHVGDIPKAYSRCWLGSCITESTTQLFKGERADSREQTRTAKAYEFARLSWNGLSQEMAQGNGEHLASLATLLAIPDDQRHKFFALAQDIYYRLSHSDSWLAPDEVIQVLEESWASSHLVAMLP
jgi:hypothetical protein